eukprot:SAG31_NODE_2205_length_6195_cov_4.592520_2_plen_172_part_00
MPSGYAGAIATGTMLLFCALGSLRPTMASEFSLSELLAELASSGETTDGPVVTGTQVPVGGPIGTDDLSLEFSTCYGPPGSTPDSLRLADFDGSSNGGAYTVLVVATFYTGVSTIGVAVLTLFPATTKGARNRVCQVALLAASSPRTLRPCHLQCKNSIQTVKSRCCETKF